MYFLQQYKTLQTLIFSHNFEVNPEGSESSDLPMESGSDELSVEESLRRLEEFMSHFDQVVGIEEGRGQRLLELTTDGLE